MPLKAFELLSGGYTGNDYTRDPVFDPLDPDNTARARWREVSTRARSVVYSPEDLVRKYGSDKFRAYGDAPPEVAARYDHFEKQKEVGVKEAGRFSPTPTATQQPLRGGTPGKVPGVANTPGAGPNPTMAASMGPAGTGSPELQQPPTGNAPATPPPAGGEGGSPPPPPPAAGTKVKYTRDELEEFKVEELKDLAAEEEVDLGGARNKSDIIDRLLGE